MRREEGIDETYSIRRPPELEARMVPVPTVIVRLHGRGWEAVGANSPAGVLFPSLGDARRMAFEWAQENRPSRVVIQQPEGEPLQVMFAAT